jgi:phenylacetate-CoA ligase
MPFVRYRIGDLVTVPDAGTECACGRSLPVIDSIDGRNSDALVAADGRLVTPSCVEGVFDTDLPLDEAQIVQTGLHTVVIRYVPSAPFTVADERALIARVRDRMGSVEVTLEAVARIPRGPNGKFRAVVCELRGKEKAALQLS